MKIFTDRGWQYVSADAGFVDDVLMVGGDNNRKIVVMDDSFEVLGSMSKEGIELNQAKFKTLEADNIITQTQKVLNYNITANHLQEVIDALSKYLSQDVTINVSGGTLDDDLLLNGFIGKGTLTLNLNNCVINGRITIYRSTFVSIVGNGTTTLNHTTENSENAVFISATNWANIEGLTINGRGDDATNGTRRGVFFADGSRGRVGNCVINNCGKSSDAATVYCNYCSQAYVTNVKGVNNFNALCSSRGATITIYGYIPPASGGVQKYEMYGGQILGSASTMTMTEGVSKPALTKTITFTPNNFRFYRTVINKWQNGIYMGDFSKSTNGSGIGGNNTGCFLFDTNAIRTALKEKTIVSVKITLQRKTSGGYDSTVTPELATVNATGTGSAPAIVKHYGALSGFTKGQSKTLTIPNTVLTDLIANTNVKGLALHRTDQKQYSIWENVCTLTVTYKE